MAAAPTSTCTQLVAVPTCTPSRVKKQGSALTQAVNALVSDSPLKWEKGTSLAESMAHILELTPLDRVFPSAESKAKKQKRFFFNKTKLVAPFVPYDCISI